MRLINFFVRCSRSVTFSKGIIATVVLISVVAGMANTAMLVVINNTLATLGEPGTLVYRFAALVALLAAAKYFSQIMLVRFSTMTTANLRVQLSERIIRTPLRRLEQLGPNRLLTTLTNDVPSVAGALAQVPNLVVNGVIVIGCLSYMAILSWKLFLLAISGVLVVMAIYHLLEQRARHLFELARDQTNILMSSFRALIGGRKELQLHQARRASFLDRGIRQTAYTMAQYRVGATRYYTMAETIGETLVFLVIGVLLFGAAMLGETSTMVLTGFIIAFLYMMTPLQFVLNTFPNLTEADISISRIEQLRESLDLDLPEISSTRSAHRTWSSIELRDVVHTYFREEDSTSFTLGPINLVLEPGRTVFLTGGNGSGKTTLAKLLTGLYAPAEGAVLLDGERVEEADSQHYRELFSAVFSDFHLFDELYGLEAGDAAAADYLNLLRLNDKVTVTDGRFSTLALSQGQRKRLALLTAYLEDRPIYLFDEWAADQDPTFRDFFYHDLLAGLKARGKTVIVISHDERFFHLADRLIKLDYGQVLDDTASPAEPVPAAV
jgi:putative pyoverdin transport system ATP-binding/permease protein